MTEANENQSKQELIRNRAATLRALRYIHTQIGSLTDHITVLQQQIHSLEHDLDLPGRRHPKAA
jgi:hypothetical protein